MTIKPGWLDRQINNNDHELRAGHPRWLCPVDSLPFPTSWDDAEELFRRLNIHFESWTGRTLEDHIKAHASVEAEAGS